VRVKRRYPLDALEALRRRATEERLASLATELDRSEHARLGVETARRAERAEADEAERVEAEGRARLEQGEERASDLARAAEWRMGALQRAEVTRSHRALAEERQKEQLAVEATARTALGDAKASERAVERHHERWSRSEEARQQAASEEEALDALATRRAATAPSVRSRRGRRGEP
jgi:hypothetical protein